MQPCKFVSLSDLISRSKKKEWIEKYNDDIHTIYTYCCKSMRGFDLSVNQFNTLLYKLSITTPSTLRESTQIEDDPQVDVHQPPVSKPGTIVPLPKGDDGMTQAELEDYKDADEFSEQVYQVVRCIKKVIKEESLHLPIYPWCVKYQTIYDYIVNL